MKAISIPAAINGNPGCYSENFTGPGFCVVAADASFFIQVGSNSPFKALVGTKVGAASGPAVGPIILTNTGDAAINVTLADFNSVTTAVTPDLQSVTGITNLTDPFLWNVWDTSAGGPSPFAAGQSLAVPVSKPYRRIWCFFDATTFPWPTAPDFESGCALTFDLNGSLVLAVPAVYRVFISPSELGFASNPRTQANQIMTRDAFQYKNSDASGKIYFLNPFDVYCACDTIQLQDVTGQLAGMIRAFLAVLSSDTPFP